MFERVYAICLPHRQDRLSELRDLFPGVVGVDAFHGRDYAAPTWFKAGAGAWGCYMSHLHVLLQATHDKLDSYLVLEDDVKIGKDFAENLAKFEQHVPDSWGQVYLGGCHRMSPEMINPFVYACHGVDRTHAFGVSKRIYKMLLTVLMQTERFTDAKGRPLHIDQVLRAAHERSLWPVYAPTWWLAGQRADTSAITFDKQRDRWWHCPAYARALPFVLCRATPNVYLQEHLWFGSEANDEGSNWRLQEAIQDHTKLVPFLLQLSTQALIYGRLPALLTDKLTTSDIHTMGFGVYLDSDDIPSIASYPYNNLINNGYYPKRIASA